MPIILFRIREVPVWRDKHGKKNKRFSPKEQFEAFQSACVEAVQMLTREGADLLVIGNEKSKCFPKELEHFRVRTPVHGGGMRVNFLVNYGWEWDLSHIAEGGQPYSCDISRIDMIIRWGGMRIFT